MSLLEIGTTRKRIHHPEFTVCDCCGRQYQRWAGMYCPDCDGHLLPQLGRLNRHQRAEFMAAA